MLADAMAAIDLYIKDFEQNQAGNMEITYFGGAMETAFVEWKEVDKATGYNVYYKEKGASDTAYTKIDDMLIREYPDNYRADILGLKAGTYDIKVVAVVDGNETNSFGLVQTDVIAHDRSGYGFVNGTSSGAYNDDGTLKSNAVVLYVTENNKDTISLDVTGATSSPCVGVQQIIEGFKKGNDNRPLNIRFIGNISDFAYMNKGDLLVDGCTNGITIEGVGEDATANGWGLRIKGSSNVEVRNIGFMNCNSSEGDSIGLQQDNDHIWVHNCDIFYGDAGSDADQVKGDGALDTKKSTYVTHSYNHFWDTGKSNLQGMKSESVDNYITYHHNWYDHSDSRHPRIRTCTVHIYNNYFDGNAKYGVGVTMGSSAFVENNYFRNVKNPMLSSLQGTDALGEGTFSGEAGGIIKSYGNVIVGGEPVITYQENNTSFDVYEASSRDEQIPSSVKTLSGGTTYNNFDTSSNFYTYQVDTAEEAKIKVEKYAGRLNGGDFQYEFDDSIEDTNYAVIDKLKQMLVNYKTSLVRVLGDTSTSGGSGGNTGGGDVTPEEPEQTLTALDVIALIEALPNASDVTSSHRSQINACKTAYDSLDTTEQAKVTNVDKLNACLDALAALPQTAEILTFDTGSQGDNPFFTVSGNLKSGIASKVYNGVTYSTALKLESSTSIKFTLNGTATVTLVTDTPSKKIKINGQSYTTDANGVLVVENLVGDITITKGDTLNLYVLFVE